MQAGLMQAPRSKQVFAERRMCDTASGLRRRTAEGSSAGRAGAANALVSEDCRRLRRRAAAFRPRNWALGYGLAAPVSSPGAEPQEAYNRGFVLTDTLMPMWYAIEGYDDADVLGRRLQARPQHLARLHALRDAGRLLLAGPCPAIDAEDPGQAGFSGSIVIAEFASLEEARAWADADPYVEAGVYGRVEVRPFRLVLP